MGFQETENPSLATFLISKHSSEPKLKEFCSDSQVFNHVKSSRSLTNPVSLSRAILKNGVALKFHPETIVYGGFSSSVSYSSKKSACATFMSKSQDFLKTVSTGKSNMMIAAYVEKHDRVVAKLPLSGLKKIVDTYKRSGTCPHSDDTVVVQAYKNLLLLEEGRTLCSIRTFLYIPSTKPIMVFLFTRSIVVRCSSVERETVDLLLASGGNDTDTSQVKYLSLLEFRNHLLRENRFPNQRTASVAFQELIHKLKRAIGGAVSAAKPKIEAITGRFGLLSADFVLDAYSLQPILAKITDAPEISSLARQFPNVGQSIITEIIRSQQVVLSRAWFNVKDTLRPEDLRGLNDFELCGYEDPLRFETAETTAFQIFPFV